VRRTGDPTATPTGVASPTRTTAADGTATRTTAADPDDDGSGGDADGDRTVATCETSWTGDPVRRFERGPGLGVPTVAAGRLLVPSAAGLFAMDPDGGVRWRRPDVRGDVAGVVDGTALVAGGDRVVAVAAASGAVLWTFEPPGEHARVGDPAVHEGTVYVGASHVQTPETQVEEPYGRLYGVDVRSGARLFRRDVTVGRRDWAEPRYAVAGDPGVFLTLESGGVLGLDHDGTRRWRRRGDDWYYPPVLAGDAVLQPTSRAVLALEAGSGETRWRDDGPEMHVGVADGVVYGAGGGGPDEDGVLAALDAATGRRRWVSQVRGCGHRPAVGSGVVAVPVGCRGGPGRFALFDADAGCRYGRFRGSTDRTPGVTVAGDRLYAVAGEDRGTLLRFDLP
jgi:outer membrane protein assembly factor BamB